MNKFHCLVVIIRYWAIRVLQLLINQVVTSYILTLILCFQSSCFFYMTKNSRQRSKYFEKVYKTFVPNVWFLSFSLFKVDLNCLGKKNLKVCLPEFGLWIWWELHFLTEFKSSIRTNWDTIFVQVYLFLDLKVISSWKDVWFSYFQRCI